MDLGGASTQIVFEPSFPDSDQLSPGDHVYDLLFSGQHHVLYQHSHLGFGLMQARRAVHNLVAFTWMWQQRDPIVDWDTLDESIEVPHPCLVKGGRKVVELDPPGRARVKVTLVGTGAGFEACRRVVDVVMAKDALCEVEPCAFGGVYQPSLMRTFGSGPIYACVYLCSATEWISMVRTDCRTFTTASSRSVSAATTSLSPWAISERSLTMYALVLHRRSDSPIHQRVGNVSARTEKPWPNWKIDRNTAST